MPNRALSDEPLPEHLRLMVEKFEYDPLTGILYRKSYTNVKGKTSQRKQVGTKHSLGYLKITVQYGPEPECNRAPYRLTTMVHRVVWYLYYGRWPGELDHINRNKADNRIANLREVDRSTNVRNCNKYDDASHAYWNSFMEKWQVRLRIQRKQYRFGRFETREQATLAANEFIANPTPETMAKYATPRKKPGKPGKNYVYRKERNIYQAQIYVKQKVHYIGSYKTENEAIEAVKLYKETHQLS